MKIDASTIAFYLTLNALGVDVTAIKYDEVQFLICLAEMMGVHHPGVFGIFGGRLISKCVDKDLEQFSYVTPEDIDAIDQDHELRAAYAEKLAKVRAWYDTHDRNYLHLASYCLARRLIETGNDIAKTREYITSYHRDAKPVVDLAIEEAIKESSQNPTK